jgi:hypothetical protein
MIRHSGTARSCVAQSFFKRFQPTDFGAKYVGSILFAAVIDRTVLAENGYFG